MGRGAYNGIAIGAGGVGKLERNNFRANAGSLQLKPRGPTASEVFAIIPTRPDPSPFLAQKTASQANQANREIAAEKDQ